MGSHPGDEREREVREQARARETRAVGLTLLIGLLLAGAIAWIGGLPWLEGWLGPSADPPPEAVGTIRVALVVAAWLAVGAVATIANMVRIVAKGRPFPIRLRVWRDAPDWVRIVRRVLRGFLAAGADKPLWVRVLLSLVYPGLSIAAGLVIGTTIFK
jgi:hypothetical protein